MKNDGVDCTQDLTGVTQTRPARQTSTESWRDSGPRHVSACRHSSANTESRATEPSLLPSVSTSAARLSNSVVLVAGACWTAR